MNIIKALQYQYSSALWTMNGPAYEDLEWNDDSIPKPSLQELLSLIDQLNKNYEDTAYQRRRKIEYPSIEDQLDMMWHMMNEDVIPGKNSDWFNTINDIKHKYPKSWKKPENEV